MVVAGDGFTDEPRQLNHYLTGLRVQARRARRGGWIALFAGGMLTLLATPLYREPGTASSGFIPFFGVAGHRIFPGGGFVAHPRALALWWLIGLPLTYAGISIGYHRQARRQGIATSPWPYVLTGLLLLAVMVGFAVAVPADNDFTIRGLVPVLVLALGYLVLARGERSWPLAIFATAFLALSVVINLYDISNLADRLGLHNVGPAANPHLAGCVLLLAGFEFYVFSDRRTAGRP